ncbi:unnamed protein product [Cylindrotheca closterium]|uniref:Uncharacterized protein n=1 Tax=Cylindrotheca closterium TaxID=2856 RepID=A0AAD2CPN7_9STRA|nr:unnamed protein product [Cylindrotheca closterium]
MNSYRPRTDGPTRTFTAGPRSSRSTRSTTSSIPKTFTASYQRSAATTTTQRTTFTNRVNRRGPTYRPPAPPKFLQRSGGSSMGQEQVKPTEDASDKKKTAVYKSSRLGMPRKTPLRQTRQPEEEDSATTSAESSYSAEEPTTEENKESLEEKKEKPTTRRLDPLVYRSKNCTFNQDYLDVLTFDPTTEDILALSSDEEEKVEEAPKVVPRKTTFKPYVKKEQSAGFGFWTSGLEDSLLATSGFSYKPAVTKKPLPKRNNRNSNESEQKGVAAPTTLTSRTAMTSSPLFF